MESGINGLAMFPEGNRLLCGEVPHLEVREVS
jgi:hypothetical protein